MIGRAALEHGSMGRQPLSMVGSHAHGHNVMDRQPLSMAAGRNVRDFFASQQPFGKVATRRKSLGRSHASHQSQSSSARSSWLILHFQLSLGGHGQSLLFGGLQRGLPFGQYSLGEHGLM